MDLDCDTDDPARPRLPAASAGTALLAALLLAGTSCSQPETRDDPNASDPTDAPTDVTVVGFNDFHGHLSSPSGDVTVDGESIPAGGAAQIAAYIDRIRQNNAHTAAVVAGDLIGASPLPSALFHDEPTVALMNRIGLDAVAVGNHEFDEGWRELRRLAEGGCHPEDGCRLGDTWEGADFPYLAANVETPDGEPLFAPYVVRKYGGEKIAYLGLTLEGVPSIVVPSAVEGLTFRDEVATIDKWVPKIRERGIEAIVVLVHEGGVPAEETDDIDDCPDLKGPIVDIVQNATDEVDAYLTAHTHRTYNCRIDGVPVTSAGSYGRLATRLDLELAPDSGDVVEAEADNVVIRADGPADEEIAARVEAYEKRAAKRAEEPVGRIDASLSSESDDAGQSPLGSVIADAQLAATDTDQLGGSDVAFMNPGGVRADLVDREDSTPEPGVVTFGDLHRAQPFRNTLVVMTLTGRQIHTLLERQWTNREHPVVLQISSESGYTWHPDRSPGNRVDPEDVTIAGEPLDLEADYRVTVNNFLAEGGDDFAVLKEGTDRRVGPLDIDALRRYVRTESPVAPPDRQRIRRVESKTSEQ